MEQSQHKLEAGFGLRVPENLCHNLLFEDIDGFGNIIFLRDQILSYLSLLQEGKTAEFLAFDSSHNCPQQDGVVVRVCGL